MTRRVRLGNTFLLLALLPFFGGCSDGKVDSRAERGQRPVLGFSQVIAGANWNAANAESVRAAAKEAGIELRMEDARSSQQNQVAALRSFIKQRVDVIAFSPVIESGWEGVLREIRAAGIPVILMDRAIEVSDDSLYVSLVGGGTESSAQRAATSTTTVRAKSWANSWRPRAAASACCSLTAISWRWVLSKP